ncbi:glycolipid 2-alpha-mannosyltransferase-domain-containing protein [Mycena alexandri]|uniref:Glycolipid 2-alpha-mannosyltransferase-domain-containing protein n=1 Tax=Mycena alexandri TaxID=1745969 RepID=A0AAD6SHM4_9AGAR|nr:glycolipid 2-alpha-mannosyltransferase-domain-containing protein [Mycena alexandri]
MHSAPRYLLVVLAVVISGHYLLSVTTTSYPRFLASSYNAAGPNPNAKNNVPDAYYYSQIINSTHTLELAERKRANATFVILARNSDLDSTVRSVREVEDRFNRRHGYPFVLLNDEPFTEEFKRRLNAVASGEVFYGQVPREHWVQPDWIDEDRATKGREQLVADNVIYGGSVSYRNMCRFNSGFFFRHPLLQSFRWYWRIEPDVHFHCDVNRSSSCRTGGRCMVRLLPVFLSVWVCRDGETGGMGGGVGRGGGGVVVYGAIDGVRPVHGHRQIRIFALGVGYEVQGSAHVLPPSSYG